MPRFRSSHANRGKGLEMLIDIASNHYAHQGRASIIQMPVPVDILNVDTRTGRVTGKLKQSTVDYYGTLQGGRSIRFDAKETKAKSLPLSNVKPHQIRHLDKEHKLGAVCFLLVGFVNEQEYYIIPFSVFQHYVYHASVMDGRKSIPLKDCRERDDIIRLQTTNGYLNIVEGIEEGWDTQ